jgi:hypothetical protein
MVHNPPLAFKRKQLTTPLNLYLVPEPNQLIFVQLETA